MPRRKPPRKQARKQAGSKSRVAKLPPEAEAARDEGPRLIPLPDERPRSGSAQDPGLPANRYVALADRALRLWTQKPDADAAAAGGDQPNPAPPRRTRS